MRTGHLFAFLVFSQLFALSCFSLGVGLDDPNGSQYLSSDHNISFYVKDPNIQTYGDGNLYVDIYYSSVQYGFSNAIVANGDLYNQSLFKCNDYNFADYTLCTYTWDTNAVIDGNYYIDLNVRDDTDLNAIDSSDSSFMVDNTAPSTTDNAPSGWQTSAFTVTLTCSDTGSGCETTYYRIDSGSWQTGTSVSVAEDGNHRIDYYSVDRAGVPEAVNTCYAALRAGGHTFTMGVILDGNYRTYSLYIPSFIDGTTVDDVATQTITAGPNIDYMAFEKNNNLFAIISTGACNEVDITNVSPSVFNLYAVHSWKPNYGKEFFFVFTKGNHYDIEKQRVAIAKGTFLKRISPVFGYTPKSAYDLQVGLDYYNTSIDVNSNLHLGPGTHSLIIRNQGTVNNRVVIGITGS